MSERERGAQESCFSPSNQASARLPENTDKYHNQEEHHE